MNQNFLSFRLLLLVLIGTLTAHAEPPADVLAKLHSPAPGIEPALLFTQTAVTNEGTGSPDWIASSGSRLTERGRDPWGDDVGAFGPAPGAGKGVAVASSTNSPLLSGDSGTLVLCFQTPEVTGDTVMILSRGAWGDPTVFDLRVDRMKSIILYSGSTNPRPQTLQVGPYVPGAWMFLGLTWKKQGQEILMDTVLGQLADGEAPRFNSFTLAHAGDPRSPLLIAGRINPELSPALLERGFFSCIAVYEHTLTREAIENLFQTMAAASKP